MKRIRQWLPTVLLIFLLLVVLIAVVTVLGIGVFHLLGYTYTSFPSVLLYFGCFVLLGLPLSILIQTLIRMLCRMQVIRTFLVKCLWFGALDVLTSMLLLEMLDLFIGGIAVKEATIFLFALLFCIIQLVAQHWGKPGPDKTQGGTSQ